MADEKEFDLSEDGGFARFKFDVESFLIGQSIAGIHAWHDRIELHLAGGRVITFTVNGEDIEILIPVPVVQRLDTTGRVQ